MEMIALLVFCELVPSVQPSIEMVWPEVWSLAEVSWIETTVALPDAVRGVGFLDLGGKGLPVPPELDWGPVVEGTGIVGAGAIVAETTGDRPEVLAPERSARPLTVIVADDFGLDACTTAGILRSFDEGLISATSMLANMPGFDEAVAAAHDRRLTGAIGVRRDLADGADPAVPPYRP
jgi:hypothetical protein